MTALWPLVRRAWGPVHLFLWLQVIFFVLVLGAFAIPNGPIVRHLNSAIAAGDFATDERNAEAVGPSVSDGFTECIALTMGLGTVAKPGLIYRTVAAGHLGGCGASRATLATYDKGHPAVQEYFRYWHGYTVITRPVLAVLGVGPLRVLLWALLAAAAAVFVWSCGAWWFVATTAITPFLLTTDAAVMPQSVPTAIAWIVALLGWALIWKRGPDRSLAKAALIAGSVYAFADFLTNPSAAWVLVAFAAGAAAYARRAPLRRVMQDTAIAGSMWFVGYAGSWATKWLLGLDAFGLNRFRQDVVGQIEFRLNGGPVDPSFGAATKANFNTWLGSGVNEALVIASLVAVVASVVTAVVYRRVRVAAALMAPVVIVPAWYEALKNHSQIHAFFTYRALPVACGLAIAAGVLASRRTPDL